MNFLRNKIISSMILITLISSLNCIYQFFIQTFGWHALINAIIFIVITNLSFLVILKISKKYNVAFWSGVAFAFLPVIINFFSIPTISIFTILLNFLALLIYTLADSTGLKHKQDKTYVNFSLLFYTIAVLCSLYSSILLFVLITYEIVSKEEVIQPLKRVNPFVVITFVAIILKILGIGIDKLY